MIGGEPGIGKSTLLIQAASKMAQNFPGKILYISGEESAAQIKDRADRLLLNCKGIEVLCTMRLEDILDSLDKINPVFVIIDSIQTVYSAEAGLVPGTVNQLKYCANELVGWVKNRDSVLIMTAHITKEENKIQLQIEVSGMDTLERTFKMFEGFHAIDNVVGSFESLTSAISENKNAWEIFMAAISTFESIMEGINTVTEIYNMLSVLSAASKIADASASGAAAAATETQAAAEGTAIAPATAATVANKALEASYLDLASAMIFAAHAIEPFVSAFQTEISFLGQALAHFPQPTHFL